MSEEANAMEQNVETVLENETEGTVDTNTSTILDRAIEATKQTSANTAKELLGNLIARVLDGTVTWDKNLTLTIETAIKTLDQKLSTQLSTIIADDQFRSLEGSWLGLQKLVKKSDLAKDLKIKIVDFNKDELISQFESSPTVDRSKLFNMVYQDEFGTAGGEPFAALLGDYYFGYSEEDVALLRYMGEVSATSHAPFIAATCPEMFDYKSFGEFTDGKPVAVGFDNPEYASWNSFRASEDSRYVALTLPRTLARAPYTSPNVESFSFEESSREFDGKFVNDDNTCVWSNACYDYGILLTKAFRKHGWCTAIRGIDNGGKVEDLPGHMYRSKQGELVQICPTEVNISDEREKELSDLGFLPLVHYKGTNHAVFLGGQTTNNPLKLTDPDQAANMAIASRLPFIMSSSRIAHYIKTMGRDHIGSNTTADELQAHLSKWIYDYVNPNALTDSAKSKTPFIEAVVSVEEHAGNPGKFAAVMNVRPWLQMEELTASLRLVAKLPS